MKNLIIITGTLMLGVFIFNMIAGDGEDTLKGVSEKAMRKTIELYNYRE
ncbi:MAG: hypothetical protein HFE74_00445 [Firmicutes bacterium]|jgi:hypothetical protein|nr:hypothetical protein [Bacillota bacterium]